MRTSGRRTAEGSCLSRTAVGPSAAPGPGGSREAGAGASTDRTPPHSSGGRSVGQARASVLSAGTVGARPGSSRAATDLPGSMPVNAGSWARWNLSAADEARGRWRPEESPSRSTAGCATCGGPCTRTGTCGSPGPAPTPKSPQRPDRLRNTPDRLDKGLGRAPGNSSRNSASPGGRWRDASRAANSPTRPRPGESVVFEASRARFPCTGSTYRGEAVTPSAGAFHRSDPITSVASPETRMKICRKFDFGIASILRTFVGSGIRVSGTSSGAGRGAVSAGTTTAGPAPQTGRQNQSC